MRGVERASERLGAAPEPYKPDDYVPREPFVDKRPLVTCITCDGTGMAVPRLDIDATAEDYASRVPETCWRCGGVGVVHYGGRRRANQELRCPNCGKTVTAIGGAWGAVGANHTNRDGRVCPISTAELVKRSKETLAGWVASSIEFEAEVPEATDGPWWQVTVDQRSASGEWEPVESWVIADRVLQAQQVATAIEHYNDFQGIYLANLTETYAQELMNQHYLEIEAEVDGFTYLIQADYPD